MHRILAIGAATVLALALSREAAAWSWPADGAVVRSFALGRTCTPLDNTAASTSPVRMARP